MTVLITDGMGGAKNVAAFLDMLAVSEGTDIPRQPTKCDGYDVLVGGKLFDDFSHHPNILVPLPRLGIKSTAAGRYQFIKRTWEDVQRRLKLPDFSPQSQDRAAIQRIRDRGALELVQDGRFYEAVSACRLEWASLPGAGYGQHEHKIETLRDAYLKAGGKLGVRQ
ncbi:MAG TPA: glycoside hydrolase family 104 protein [Pyrinomonadaceae bacterium]|nr:glycoside hydrolase family 104 protein [Pyrinomonadaceae bacterium]